MDAKTVTALRKEGKIEEALALSKELLAQDAENIWNKRAAAWVYYKLLKTYANNATSARDFIDTLKAINALNLPEDDKMVFDNSAYQIVKIIYKLISIDAPSNLYNAIVVEILHFHLSMPSESFSSLLSALLRAVNKKKNDGVSIYLVNHLEYLRVEDFSTQSYEGRELPSLAERLYNASLKFMASHLEHLIAQDKLDDSFKKELNEFLQGVDKVRQDHPEFVFIPYHLAQVKDSLGQKEEAIALAIPFVRKKKSDFWAWSFLANLYKDDIDMQLSFLSKALLIGGKEEFVKNVRQDFYNVLIKKEYYDEARFELDIIYNTTDSARLKSNIEKGRKTVQWYKNAKVLKSNLEFYTKHATNADKFLYRDIEETVVAISFVNKNKRIVNYIIDKNNIGFFKLSKNDQFPLVGQLYTLKIIQKTNEGFTKVATMIPTSLEDNTCPAVKTVEGVIKIKDEASFGFVEDVFIAEHLLKSCQCVDGDALAVKALLSFNKKKEEWGWRAFKVEEDK